MSFFSSIALGVLVVLALLNLRRDRRMSEALERLRAEVEETKTAAQSAVTLISGLAAQIRDNVEDPEALSALADSLDETQAALAAAVTANTPAADDGTLAQAPE